MPAFARLRGDPLRARKGPSFDDDRNTAGAGPPSSRRRKEKGPARRGLFRKERLRRQCAGEPSGIRDQIFFLLK